MSEVWTRAALALAATLVMGGCPTEEGVPAIWDPDRPEHFFDLPFPHCLGAPQGQTLDLSAFPRADGELLGEVVAGWVARTELTTQGFPAGGPAYFRFEGPLDLPSTTPGEPGDPVLMLDTHSGALFPLELRFVEDPGDDPFLAPNTLIVSPLLGHFPSSGAQLVVAVMRSAGVAPPGAWYARDHVESALLEAGIDDEPAVGIVYHTQPSTQQLRALAADADQRFDQPAFFDAVDFERVVELSYTSGQTPGGRDAILCTATYEDGGGSTAYLAPRSDHVDHSVDLGDSWPMAVYEAELPVLLYQGLEDRPYMSPGVMHLTDIDRYSGWIEFDWDTVVSVPDVDMMRIVVSMPKDGSGRPRDDVPVVIWDHGTGGTAYNHVQRRNAADDNAHLNTLFREYNVAVIGRDASLYGTRYPLVEEGFDDGSLGFYNIVNLPAFRDNQRQTGIEGHIVRRFVQLALNDKLPAGSVDPTRVRRVGHSLGAATAHNGMVAGTNYEAGFVSGSSSVFALSFLETGLGASSGGLMESLADLFGVEIGPDDSVGKVIALALGIEDPEAQARFDRMHPVVMLFSWLVDPSDPATFARDETLPVTILMGVGDRQIPNIGTEALAEMLPDAELVVCEIEGDYDPHYCLYRDETGFQAMADWLAGP